ncbi:MAG: universal stress protein [Gemmatimonadota bacterium]|jgi:nucleotide-binding universal stress UspA family protein
MIELRNILFPTDFSECSRQALSYAAKLATEHGAELHVMHAIVLHEDDPHDPAHHLPDPQEIRNVLEKLAEKRMGALVQEHDIPDLVLTQVHRRGVSPAPPIVEYAREADVDLIVMGTHGRRGVRRLLMGSVAAEVVRMAPCSVLTVHGSRGSEPVGDFRHILMPVDFFLPSIGALGVACAFAKQYGSDLHIAHVLGDVLHPAFYNMGATRPSDLQPEILSETTSALESLLREAGNCGNIQTECHVLEGHPAREIVRFARDHTTDLIVLASHGHTGIKHVLLGGTAEKVISGVECPVLVVKVSGKPLFS